MTSASCFAQLRSPVGQLGFNTWGARKEVERKATSEWPERRKKYIFGEGRRMREFLAENGSNVWITCAVFWVQHPSIQSRGGSWDLTATIDGRP